MISNKERKNRVEIRLNDAEYKALRDFSDRQNISLAEALRDYVKSLPRPTSTTSHQTRPSVECE